MKVNTSLDSDDVTEQFKFRDKLLGFLIIFFAGIFSVLGVIYILNEVNLLFVNAVTKSRNIIEQMDVVAQTPEFNQCIEQLNGNVKQNSK